jgi:hypothetical protein
VSGIEGVETKNNCVRKFKGGRERNWKETDNDNKRVSESNIVRNVASRLMRGLMRAVVIGL